MTMTNRQRLFLYVALAIAGWFIASVVTHAASVESVSSTNQLVQNINPRSKNTNYFVVGDTGVPKDGSAAIWTYDPNSVVPEDTNYLKPLLYGGRWIRNFTGGGANVFTNSYTNIFFDTLYTTNLYVTNLFAEFSYISNLFVTNLTVYGDTIFRGRVDFTTNVYVTNATIFINGTNVATINPTDNYVPYRTGTNSFGDSPLYRISTNQMGFFNTNVFLQLLPGTYFGFPAPSLALGLDAGLALTTTGVYNTAIGNNSLQRATSGSFTTAFGQNAGNSRTTGGQNVIIGNDAMGNELVAGTSSYNVAVGNEALYGLIDGEQNTAVGFQASKFVTSGNHNTALGSGAYGGDTGDMNVAIGRASMITASGGGSNTMVGAYSGHIIESGSWNVGLGFEATPSVNSITNTIAIGTAAKTTNNNEIVIGNAFNTKAIFPITSYTGAGTLFLSDDGTYKTAGGGPGGDTIWTNDMTLTTLLPGKGASVVLGANAVPWWAPNASDGFTVVHDQSAGESDTTYIYAAAVDDSGASTNNAGFQITLSSTAQAAAQLNLTATTNAVTSRFNVSLQPDAGVSTIVLENQGATKFAVASDSLFTGTGTLFLSDDGTYKAAGGSGDTIWTNNAGVIEPLGGQDTNVLRFTSGLADNATNVALVVDTAASWTQDNSKLLSLRMAGNEQASVSRGGGLTIGPNTSGFWGAYADNGEALLCYRDIATEFDGGQISVGSFSSANSGLAAFSGGGDSGFGGNMEALSQQANGAQSSFNGRALGTNQAYVRVYVDGWSTSGDSKLYAQLQPVGTSTLPNYLFSTFNPASSGVIAAVQNAKTNKFTVAYDGAITTGGNTNRWIFKDVVEAATTNLTVNVNTKDYVITLGGGGSGTTINPTDTYIPYRSNATTFADSPIWVAPSGDTMVDGAIDVGGSGTSQFSGPVEFADTVTLLSATVTNNIGALLSVGDTTFVDMAKASQTNALTAALTFAHATNGVAGVEYTHVRTFYNDNGADYLVTLPAAWINPDGASFTLTNNGIVKLYVNSMGPTADAASQTNVISQIKFCK